MNENDLKKYTVLLGSGSGILFQPVDSNLTYVLSAKHIFYDKSVDDRGIDKEVLKNEICLSFSESQEDVTVLSIKRGENYFEHSEQFVDAAIFVLENISGYDQIFSEDENVNFSNYNLTGYPESRRKGVDKYNKYKINDFISSADGNINLRLEISHLAHKDITGFSGGGIIKIINDNIVLAGIQSKTPEADCNGEIVVVPIVKFQEIVKEHGLPELLPAYLVNFKFLQNKVFDISAGLDDEDISYTRLFLKTKAFEVISSDITPQYIKDYFKDRLLVNDKDTSKLNDELIYVTWLEFLTLINIVKEKSCNTTDLQDIFSCLRLLYRKTETDWLETDFLKDCLMSNYDGLEENGTVFIKTSRLPSKQSLKHYKLDKGSVVSRIDTLKKGFENGTLNSDVNNITSAISDLKDFVFDKYNFIHFEYLKHYMLIENSDDFKSYKKSNENDLLIKLKEEYGKIFGI